MADRWNEDGCGQTEPDSFGDLLGVDGKKLLLALYTGGSKKRKKVEDNDSTSQQPQGTQGTKNVAGDIDNDLMDSDGDGIAINASDLDDNDIVPSVSGKHAHPESAKKDDAQDSSNGNQSEEEPCPGTKKSKTMTHTKKDDEEVISDGNQSEESEESKEEPRRVTKRSKTMIHTKKAIVVEPTVEVSVSKTSHTDRNICCI
ncbi:hypothetical protein DFS34DRAFT_651149 [Phlyctochytrium arcticum]|nr:hypothetical protein DFS34DRAFT_651149 [Phlyctochytrium arcticum]